MIRHVVLWELHDPGQAPAFADRLRACAGIVPGMLSFEVATPDAQMAASAHVCLIATFVDLESLRAYEAHALHRKVSEQLRHLRKHRHFADFVANPAAG